MYFKQVCKNEINFLLEVPFLGPFENVDIYFLKIDLKIFEGNNIFILLY